MRLGSVRYGILLLSLTLAACSRSSSEGAPRETPSAAPLLAPSGTDAAPSPPAGPSAILTPEDVEPEVEHRITEENLERELDRLEREIQAE